MRFLFKGAELMEAHTFEFYGLRDGDAIIALPADGQDSICVTSQWLSLTRDTEAFNESLKWMFDTRTYREAARLRDQHLLRVEARSRRSFTISPSYLDGLALAGSTGDMETNWEPPIGPSTEMLPVLWGPGDTQN
jgi:hypothetical protein